MTPPGPMFLSLCKSRNLQSSEKDMERNMEQGVKCHALSHTAKMLIYQK